MANTLTYRGSDIMLTTGDGTTLGGFSWNGSQLVRKVGKGLVFNAAKNAEIDAAIRSYVPDTYSQTNGYDITDGMEDFVITQKIKSNHDGSGAIVISFEKSDLA